MYIHVQMQDFPPSSASGGGRGDSSKWPDFHSTVSLFAVGVVLVVGVYKVAKANYEKYGNPDGPGNMKVGMGLPRFLVEEKYQLLVLSCFFLFLLVLLPMAFLCYYQRQKKYARKDHSHKTPMLLFLRPFGALSFISTRLWWPHLTSVYIVLVYRVRPRFWLAVSAVYIHCSFVRRPTVTPSGNSDLLWLSNLCVYVVSECTYMYLPNCIHLPFRNRVDSHHFLFSTREK